MYVVVVNNTLLKKIMMLTESHLTPIESEFLGARPRHLFLEKALQVMIVMAASMRTVCATTLLVLPITRRGTVTY